MNYQQQQLGSPNPILYSQSMQSGLAASPQSFSDAVASTQQEQEQGHEQELALEREQEQDQEQQFESNP